MIDKKSSATNQRRGRSSSSFELTRRLASILAIIIVLLSIDNNAFGFVFHQVENRSIDRYLDNNAYTFYHNNNNILNIIIGTYGTGTRRNSQHGGIASSSSISIRRRHDDDDNDNGSIQEYISKLEDDFRRSSITEGNDDPNPNPNEPFPPQHPPPPQHPFRTPVTTHTAAIDLLNTIDSSPPNHLTAVLFFAHYCKTCQRALVPFKKLANEYAEEEDGDSSSSTYPPVRFVRLETSALSPTQFRSLGIDRIPFLQIYRNGICVASFSATERTGGTARMVLRPRLLNHIDICRRRSVMDWMSFRDLYDGEIERNKAAWVEIREEADGRGRRDEKDGDGSIRREEERLYRGVRTLTSESDLLHLLVSSDHDDDDGESHRDEEKEEEEEAGEALVVIMFHSHFDPSCLRAQHKFRKIASERQRRSRRQQQKPLYGIQHNKVTMARIEASVLPDATLRRLGIDTFPSVQIYRNSSRTTTTATTDNTDNTDNNNPSTIGETATTKDCIASFSIPRSFLFSKMLHGSLDDIDRRTSREWMEFYRLHRREMENKKVALEEVIRERQRQQQQHLR